MKHQMITYGIVLLSLTAGACGGHRLGAQAVQAMTLESALESIPRALDAMSEKRSGKVKYGLMPEEVDVTMNVGLSTDDKGTLSVTLPVLENASVGGQKSAEASTSSTNIITVIFKNLFFADQKTVIGFYAEKYSLHELLDQLASSTATWAVDSINGKPGTNAPGLGPIVTTMNAPDREAARDTKKYRQAKNTSAR